MPPQENPGSVTDTFIEREGAGINLKLLQVFNLLIKSLFFFSFQAQKGYTKLLHNLHECNIASVPNQAANNVPSSFPINAQKLTIFVQLLMRINRKWLSMESILMPIFTRFHDALI